MCPTFFIFLPFGLSRRKMLVNAKSNLRIWLEFPQQCLLFPLWGILSSFQKIANRCDMLWDKASSYISTYTLSLKAIQFEEPLAITHYLSRKFKGSIPRSGSSTRGKWCHFGFKPGSRSLFKIDSKRLQVNPINSWQPWWWMGQCSDCQLNVKCMARNFYLFKVTQVNQLL